MVVVCCTGSHNSHLLCMCPGGAAHAASRSGAARGYPDHPYQGPHGSPPPRCPRALPCRTAFRLDWYEFHARLSYGPCPLHSKKLGTGSTRACRRAVLGAHQECYTCKAEPVVESSLSRHSVGISWPQTHSRINSNEGVKTSEHMCHACNDVADFSTGAAGSMHTPMQCCSIVKLAQELQGLRSASHTGRRLVGAV